MGPFYTMAVPALRGFDRWSFCGKITPDNTETIRPVAAPPDAAQNVLTRLLRIGRRREWERKESDAGTCRKAAGVPRIQGDVCVYIFLARN